MSNRVDHRIAMGSRCSWWGSIYEVAKSDSGLPLCPFCKGSLYESSSIEDFERDSRRLAVSRGQDPDTGWRRTLWARGRCLQSLEGMNKAFADYDSVISKLRSMMGRMDSASQEIEDFLIGEGIDVSS